MNRKYNSLAVLGLAAVAALSLANSGGSPGGRTGSEVDNGATCATMGGCHAGGGDVLTQDMITTNIPATGYIPGEKYQITLSPAFDGASRYGFEMIVQNATPEAVGTFTSNDDGNARSGGDRVTHKSSSSTGGDTKTWVLDWTAPEAGSGDLKIFASSLAANGNGSTSGDRLITDDLTITENLTASIQDILNAQITLYPNPVVNSLHLSGMTNTNATLQITDVSGRVVMNSSYAEMLDVSQLATGAYQLKIAVGDVVINKNFIKR